MNTSEREGRKSVLILFAVALCLSATIIIWFNVAIGSQNLPSQLLRFAVKAALMYLTFSGLRFTKWLLCALYFVDVVQAYSKLLSVETKGETYFFGAMGALYLGFILLLLFSKNIAAFLAYKEANS